MSERALATAAKTHADEQKRAREWVTYVDRCQVAKEASKRARAEEDTWLIFAGKVLGQLEQLAGALGSGKQVTSNALVELVAVPLWYARGYTRCDSESAAAAVMARWRARVVAIISERGRACVDRRRGRQAGSTYQVGTQALHVGGPVVGGLAVDEQISNAVERGLCETRDTQLGKDLVALLLDRIAWCGPR